MRALVLLLLLTACSSTTPATAPDRATTCCAECRDGASKDPQGRDLSLLDCAPYAVTEACRAWFVEHPTFVQDCR